MTRTRRAPALLGLGLAVLAAVLVPAAPAAAALDPVERVLVVSLPTLSWQDLEDLDLPHLEAFLDEAAIGGFSTRSVDRRTTPGDAYTTIAAGTRADGDDDVDGQNFEVGEGYLGEPADEVFARRTGIDVTSGLFSLALPMLEAANADLDFGAELGALGDALDEGGVRAAVIANADGDIEDPDVAYGRQAELGLMDGEGRVPTGRLADDLLEADPSSPFGRRLDLAEVEEAFADVWRDDSVVLVEASDLARVDAYRDLATGAQRTRQRAAALVRSDELFGRLLAEVDPERDAVLVIGPYPQAGDDHLTVAGLAAPGVDPGLLKSAVTRRSGFVTIVDVAPTILELVDVPLPDSMEGRPFERAGTGGSAVDRRTWLVRANEEAQWRDGVITGVATAFVIAQLVLWVVAVLALGRHSARARRAVEVASLAVLSVLPLTYLARPLPFHEWGLAAYWLWLIGGGVLVAVLAQRLLRRWPADPLIGVLGLMLGVLLIDVTFVGGYLQINTVFGYTPTVAGRFAGLGNLAFAQIAASSTILAGLLASRISGRRGIGVALGLLGVVLVVDASPFWGSDVGGALTMVPTFAGVAAVLLGMRLRLRTAVLVGLGTVVLFVLAGMVDLARPEESRTHLGRLFEDIGANGFEAFETVVVRKIGANLAVLTSSEWTLMIPVVFAFVLYLIWRAPGRLQRLREVIPQERAARVGFVIAAVLGFALNDSGIAVPGLMLGVMNASLVYLVLRTEDPPWKAEIDDAALADLDARGSGR